MTTGRINQVAMLRAFKISLTCRQPLFRERQSFIQTRKIKKNASHLPSQHTQQRCTERADLQYGLILLGPSLTERKQAPSTNLQNRAHRNGSTDTLIQASIFTRSPLNSTLGSTQHSATQHHQKTMIELNQTASENLSVGSSIADRRHMT